MTTEERGHFSGQSVTYLKPGSKGRESGEHNSIGTVEKDRQLTAGASGVGYREARMQMSDNENGVFGNRDVEPVAMDCGDGGCLPEIYGLDFEMPKFVRKGLIVI